MKRFMILVLCVGVCVALCGTDSWGACKGITTAGNIKGDVSQWTHVGTVKKGSIMRVRASGKVDFGCAFCRCVDGPTAGVEGKSLAFVKIFDTLKQQTDAAKTLNPFDAAQKNINALKNLFGTTHQPNFDQGGVWIKVLKKNRTPYIATQLYYFWEHEGGINKYGLPINEDVDIYAKAHDGGKSPEAMKNYGDNHGAYTVRIESHVMQSASGGGTSAGTPISDQPHHGLTPGSQQGGQSYAAGQGTRINVRSCTTCGGGCTAGHTCIYVNNSCFVSCQ